MKYYNNDADESIKVTKARNRSEVQISSNSVFFDGYVIIKHNHEMIEFTKPTIDYTGKQRKFNNKSKICLTADSAKDQLVPLGTFAFDYLESTEDYRIAYFKPKE